MAVHRKITKSQSPTKIQCLKQPLRLCAEGCLAFFGMSCRSKSDNIAEIMRAQFCTKVCIHYNPDIDTRLCALARSTKEKNPNCPFEEDIVIVVIFSGACLSIIMFFSSHAANSAFTKLHHKNFHIVELASRSGISFSNNAETIAFF